MSRDELLAIPREGRALALALLLLVQLFRRAKVAAAVPEPVPGRGGSWIWKLDCCRSDSPSRAFLGRLPLLALFCLLASAEEDAEGAEEGDCCWPWADVSEVSEVSAAFFLASSSGSVSDVRSVEFVLICCAILGLLLALLACDFVSTSASAGGGVRPACCGARATNRSCELLECELLE